MSQRCLDVNDIGIVKIETNSTLRIETKSYKLKIKILETLE